MLGRVRVSQLLAFLLVVTAIIILLVIRSRIRRSGDPAYLACYVTTDKWEEECSSAKGKKKKETDTVQAADDITKEDDSDE